MKLFKNKIKNKLKSNPVTIEVIDPKTNETFLFPAEELVIPLESKTLFEKKKLGKIN